MNKKKFDKPLGEFIEEEKEINYPRFSMKDGQPNLEVGKRTIKERVKYVAMEKKKKFSCANGRHKYFMLDRHKHIAKCENCMKHRYLRAVYETIIKGNIVDRETGDIID